MIREGLKQLFLPILICFTFFTLYAVLASVRHNHYQSFGYDLGINDQVVWEYSNFLAPISTISPNPGTLKLTNHVELVFALIAPFYWIWSSPLILILLQDASICISAIFVYKLARKYKLSQLTANILVISYLMFFGVQFSLWTDVHSSVFGAAFTMAFIYFLDLKKFKLTFLFFLLSITSKETTGSAIFFVSLVYLWYRREKIYLFYLLGAAFYMFFIFYIFFPKIMHVKYLYENSKGLFSNINPISLFDTSEKRFAIFYSFASWGFISLLSPIMLIPILGHFFKFFVLASDLTSAQGIFGQYRVGVAPLFALSTIWVLKRFKLKTQIVLSIWLLIATFSMQYFLHLPLSYLSKQWFWKVPESEQSNNYVIKNYLPKNASVVSQNNIVPHISQRKEIYVLYPQKKHFSKNSPCGQVECDWFRWSGKPEFLIIDTSSDWDIRHFLTSRKEYLAGVKNLEKEEIISKLKQEKTTILYKVLKKPS